MPLGDEFEDTTSSPETAFPGFHLESQSSHSSDPVQDVPKSVSVFKTTQLSAGTHSDIIIPS